MNHAFIDLKHFSIKKKKKTKRMPSVLRRHIADENVEKIKDLQFVNKV
jgi:hypothetical protein